VNIEHDRGAFNGRAEISGTAVDQWGGALEGAVVQLRSVLSAKIRRTNVDADGRFRLGDLPPADYEIAVFNGSGSVLKRVELEPRDRAILSVLLRQEHSEAIVAVSDTGRMVADFKVGFGMAGGVAGGVMGGVVGDAAGMPLEARNFQAVGMAPPAPHARLALPMAQMVEVTGANDALRNSATLAKEKDEAGTAPRARSYFPEALYINPEIITDKDGIASITIPLATRLRRGGCR